MSNKPVPLKYTDNDTSATQWSHHSDVRMRNPAQRRRMQRAVDMTDNTHVVQRKENGSLKGALPHAALETRQKGDPKPDHPYMKMLVWGRAKSRTIFGSQYTTRFLYSGTVSDWKKFLADLDSDCAVNNYLVPFFVAVSCVGGSVRTNMQLFYLS